MFILHATYLSINFRQELEAVLKMQQVAIDKIDKPEVPARTSVSKSKSCSPVDIRTQWSEDANSELDYYKDNSIFMTITGIRGKCQ